MEPGHRIVEASPPGISVPADARGGWESPLNVVPVPNASRSLPVVAAVVGATLILLVALVRQPGGEQVVVSVSDVATSSAAALALVTCVGAARRHVGEASSFWWLLAAAMGAWLFGELAWSWYEVVLRVTVPTPSLADVGYLTAPVLAVAAFARHPASRGRKARRLIPLLDAVALACALLFVSWTFVLGPLWASSGGPSATAFVELGYPFSDVVLVVLVVLVLRDLRANDRTAVLLLLGGMLCMAVSDGCYTYLTQIGGYASGDLLDVGWFASYLAIAAAGFLSRRDSATSLTPEHHARLLSLAPYVPVLIALVVIAVELSGGAGLDPAEWVIATSLAVIVLFRQVIDLTLREGWPGPTGTGPATNRLGHAKVVSRGPSGSLRNVRPLEVSSSRRGERPDPAHELTEVALELIAASRPTAQAQVQRVFGRSVVALTSIAAVLAVWDLSLLVRGIPRS